MKKYDFNNPQVFEQLEDKAIDGQLDYSNFPPPEYKYFSRLAKVGYNNRHKGWDINICLERQYELRTEYKRDRDNADEYRMLSQRIMDNVMKSADFVHKMYQSQTNEQTVINALQALECLTNENGLTKRITEKLQKIKCGQWIVYGFDETYNCYEACCSNCEAELDMNFDGDKPYIDLNTEYCPHCGAKMNGWCENNDKK